MHANVASLTHFLSQVNAPVFSIPHEFEKLYPASPAGSGAQTGSEWTLDRAYYLKKMSRAMLLNFLELVGILSQNPAEFGDKIVHLNTLLVNMHQLINDYRPHQARETLITMMEEQLEKKKAEVEGIKKMREKIDGILRGLARGAQEPQALLDLEEGLLPSPEEIARAEQRSIWEALEEELER
jgi:mediator of RNA polymerase II transcription subunit 7